MGKVARTKRAKSANLRNSSARSKASDKKKLVTGSQSSSTDTVNNETNDKNCENTDLDYAEERIKLVKESLKQAVDVAQIRPINIDVALEEQVYFNTFSLFFESKIFILVEAPFRKHCEFKGQEMGPKFSQVT